MKRADDMATKASLGEQLLGSGGIEMDFLTVRTPQTDPVAAEKETPCCCPQCFPFF